MGERPSAVIFGAGSVGRGFLGQLFSESGYDIVFVDIDQPLIEALARQGRYTLRLAGVVKTEDLNIGPLRAIHSTETDAVVAEVQQASIMATAVGARALKAIAKPIAAGLEQRWQTGNHMPLNLVGLRPAVSARMSPVPTDAQRAGDPTLIIAEPYKILPVDRDAFIGPIPKIIGLEPVHPFIAYVERKLYLHNAGHALLGYLGYLRGYVYGYDALDDPYISPLLHLALDESRRALIAAHGFDRVALAEHVQDLLTRFANRALADPIARLARDPLRKLSPGDRLIGAARLAEQHQIEPDGLAWGIAAALAYDHPQDPHAQALQTQLRQEGLVQTLRTICGIREDEPLADMISQRYRRLQEDANWQKRH